MSDGGGAWKRSALCRAPEVPTSWFYAAKGDLGAIAAARDLCRRCPVQEACGDAGYGEVHGMWGGQSPRERQRRRTVDRRRRLTLVTSPG